MFSMRPRVPALANAPHTLSADEPRAPGVVSIHLVKHDDNY